MVRIYLKGEPTDHLATITTGRAASLELVIAGAPRGLQELEFHAGSVTEEGSYTAVAATPLGGNKWHVYASGLCFRDAGSATYHITGKDPKDASTWLGSGKLKVLASVLHVSEEETPIVPEDCYIRNPTTGLWHKLTATVDEAGEIVLTYSKEGITR